MDSVRPTLIRHPSSAYLIVVFAALCMTAAVRAPWQTVVYLIPIAGACYIARTATLVDETGLTARALFGSQTVRWDELRGLRLDSSGTVYAVDTHDTQLRLPCVRSTKLQRLIAASAGRIPDPAAEPQ
ncbi:MAG TPA: PH domain-containing protein [Jatrophihabitans sp.]